MTERPTKTVPAPPDTGPVAASDRNGIPRVALRDLVVERGPRRVLDGLTIEVRRGEVFGLLGPNGAGKTTAFHALVGLLPTRSGRVELDGRSVGPGAAELRRSLGVVFQEPALDPRLTARENLSLAATMYRVPRAEAAERIDSLLAEVGLLDRADDRIGTFSGGMKRRVELARALVHAPSILVLDEPSTGLDQAAFRGMWDTLRRIGRTRELTMILTTHRPDEAEACHRLAILDGGKLVACDTPDALRRQVRGDLLVLEANDPESVAATLRERFDLRPRLLGERVVFESDRAHEWIPRVVEAIPEGTLRSVQLRRTGLGEVFLELTGHELDDALEDAR